MEFFINIDIFWGIYHLNENFKKANLLGEIFKGSIGENVFFFT